MGERKEKIQWHSAFCGAAELELRENKDDLEFEQERVLGKQPPRTDLLIIKKHLDAKIKNEIGRLFKGHNVVEYKSPSDALSIDDLFKTIGYACLYKGQGATVDEIPADEITVSLFREQYPHKLMNEIRRLGGTIKECFQGIYYVEGIVVFEIQIVVMNSLNKEQHSSLRVLSREAKAEDVGRFLENVRKYNMPDDIANAEAVMRASVAANQKIYEIEKGEDSMYETIHWLFREEIENEKKQVCAEARAEARKKGLAEGRAQGLAEARAEALEEAREEALEEAHAKIITTMLKKNQTPEMISDLTDEPLENVLELQRKMLGESATV
jgi:hypothetical protein